MGNAEWDFFARIENLEQDIKTAKPTLKDANIVSMFAFGLAFGAVAVHVPDQARRIKDSYLGYLKASGLSPKMLDILEQAMLEACDMAEESRKIA
ncbi:MAG: hypothetical protein KAW00_06055 [Dehalococcoidia bacterium]|nr:hypothetical protein [Dehalococcoidia bacterium]